MSLENSIAALNQKLPSLSSLPGRPKANESDVEKELAAWRDDLKLLTQRVAKHRAARRDLAPAAVSAVPTAIRAIAELERAACGGLDAPAQSALLAIAPMLVCESADEAQDDEVSAQLFAMSCEDLVQVGHKELRALRREADKARERLVAAIHKSNAFQTKVKLPADLHKLLELETDRARCDRDLLNAERAVRRAARRLVVVRDAELLDSLVSFVAASRIAEAYAHAASADLLVADARDNAVSARRRATVLRQRHASAAARADERRDIAAVDRLLDAFDATAVSAMADAALGLRRNRPAALKRVASSATASAPTPPPKPAGQSSNSTLPPLPPKPAGQSSNSALPQPPASKPDAATDVPAHFVDAQGAPFYEPLVALHRLRRGPHPAVTFAQLLQACVTLRNAAAPFVLPAVLRLCGVNDDPSSTVAPSSSSAAASASPSSVGGGGSAGGAVSPRGGDGAAEAAPTEAANSEVTAGRLLLEAFVCIDVDLAFHGHESPAGRGLPGKWVGRVGSDLPRVLERSLKN